MINKKIDLEKELFKFKQKLRKEYIDTLTSSQYKYPPDSKELATVRWITVSVVFDCVVDKMFNKKGE